MTYKMGEQEEHGEHQLAAIDGIHVVNHTAQFPVCLTELGDIH